MMVQPYRNGVAMGVYGDKDVWFGLPLGEVPSPAAAPPSNASTLTTSTTAADPASPPPPTLVPIAWLFPVTCERTIARFQNANPHFSFTPSSSRGAKDVRDDVDRLFEVHLSLSAHGAPATTTSSSSPSLTLGGGGEYVDLRSIFEPRVQVHYAYSRRPRDPTDADAMAVLQQNCSHFCILAAEFRRVSLRYRSSFDDIEVLAREAAERREAEEAEQQRRRTGKGEWLPSADLEEEEEDDSASNAPQKGPLRTKRKKNSPARRLAAVGNRSKKAQGRRRAGAASGDEGEDDDDVDRSSRSSGGSRWGSASDDDSALTEDSWSGSAGESSLGRSSDEESIFNVDSSDDDDDRRRGLRGGRQRKLTHKKAAKRGRPRGKRQRSADENDGQGENGHAYHHRLERQARRDLGDALNDRDPAALDSYVRRQRAMAHAAWEVECDAERTQRSAIRAQRRTEQSHYEERVRQCEVLNAQQAAAHRRRLALIEALTAPSFGTPPHSLPPQQPQHHSPIHYLPMPVCLCPLLDEEHDEEDDGHGGADAKEATTARSLPRVCVWARRCGDDDHRLPPRPTTDAEAAQPVAATWLGFVPAQPKITSKTPSSFSKPHSADLLKKEDEADERAGEDAAAHRKKHDAILLLSAPPTTEKADDFTAAAAKQECIWTRSDMTSLLIAAEENVLGAASRNTAARTTEDAGYVTGTTGGGVFSNVGRDEDYIHFEKEKDEADVKDEEERPPFGGALKRAHNGGDGDDNRSQWHMVAFPIMDAAEHQNNPDDVTAVPAYPCPIFALLPSSQGDTAAAAAASLCHSASRGRSTSACSKVESDASTALRRLLEALEKAQRAFSTREHSDSDGDHHPNTTTARGSSSPSPHRQSPKGRGGGRGRGKGKETRGRGRGRGRAVVDPSTSPAANQHQPTTTTTTTSGPFALPRGEAARTQHLLRQLMRDHRIASGDGGDGGDGGEGGEGGEGEGILKRMTTSEEEGQQPLQTPPAVKSSQKTTPQEADVFQNGTGSAEEAADNNAVSPTTPTTATATARMHSVLPHVLNNLAGGSSRAAQRRYNTADVKMSPADAATAHEDLLAAVAIATVAAQEDSRGAMMMMKANNTHSPL